MRNGEHRSLCPINLSLEIFGDSWTLLILRDMIFGGIEHRTWNFLRGQGDFSVEEVGDSIADLIFHGLARRPAPDPQAAAAALAELRAKTRAIDEALDALQQTLEAPGFKKVR